MTGYEKDITSFALKFHSPIETDALVSYLMGAYKYCVTQSRSPRDSWDNASLDLIVRAEALKGSPLAIILLDRQAREASHVQYL